MRYIILAIALFLQSNNLYSQIDKQYDEAVAFVLKRDYNKAIEKFNKIIEKNPEFKDIYAQRGQCYIFTDKYDEALNDFTKAIKKDPKKADYYNFRGLSYLYMGKYEDAIKDFDKSISLDSKFTEAYLNRGSIFIAQKKFDEGLADLNQAIKLDKNNPDAYFQRAMLQYDKKEYKKSIEDFDIVVKKGIKNEDIYFSRANAFFKLNDFKNAISDYTNALKYNPKNTNALNNRAVSYDAIGDTTSAENDREKLAEITGVRFPAFDKLEWTTYTSNDSTIQISMPTGWSKRTDTLNGETNLQLYFNNDPINPNPFGTSVTISLNRNMKEKFGYSDPVELLEFWKASNAKNATEYHKYNLSFQKNFSVNGIPAVLFASSIILEEGAPEIRLYELALAKENELVYAYFQSDAYSFAYFEKIYEKAVKTLYLP